MGDHKGPTGVPLRNAWLAFVMRCVLEGGYFGAFGHYRIGREDEKDCVVGVEESRYVDLCEMLGNAKGHGDVWCSARHLDLRRLRLGSS
jgi:hypothetical protein